MKSCFTEVLDGILLRCAEALFDKHGIKLSRAIAGPGPEPGIDERHVGALIAFEGSRIRGSLLLISTFQMAAIMRASPRKAVDLSSRVAADWIVIRDWTGELANQLLGRIKNRLQVFDVDFRIGTPMLLSGAGLSLAARTPTRTSYIVHRRGEDMLQIVVDVRQPPQLASIRPAPGAEESAREGDVIEF